MGLFDDNDELDALVEESNQFEPLDLNEAEVRALVNRCGKPKADGNIDWDVGALKKNRENIRYLLGQLAPVHQGVEKHELDRVFCKRYDGRDWTVDSELLICFLFMGKVNDFCSISQKDGGLLIEFNLGKAGFSLLKKLSPTLSPKDSKFAAWWEGADGLMIQVQAAEDEDKPDEDLFSLYAKAARLGGRDAQYKAGVWCAFGKGTQKDSEAALQWFQAAAKQGHEKAGALSGIMCKKGLFGTKVADLKTELSKMIDRSGTLSDSERKLLRDLCKDDTLSAGDLLDEYSKAVMGSLDKTLSNLR